MTDSVLRTMFLFVLLFSSAFSQDNHSLADEKAVETMLANFHRSLFSEMDPLSAFHRNFFMGRIDAIDSKYGLQNNFIGMTKDFKPKNKLSSFVIQRYFLDGLPEAQMKLGTERISADTELSFSALAQDRKVLGLWKQVLSDLGLTEDELEKLADLDERKIGVFENHFKAINSTIRKHSDLRIIESNLDYIKLHSKTSVDIFEGRKYYKVDSPLFLVTVALKDHVPKIVFLNSK